MKNDRILAKALYHVWLQAYLRNADHLCQTADETAAIAKRFGKPVYDLYFELVNDYMSGE